MNNGLLVLIFISILSLSGCLERSATELKFSKPDNTFRENQMIRGEAPLNYASLKKYVLKPKCMSCHSGTDAKPKNDPIDFSSYETAMVDRFVPLLLKGKPEKSRLFKSVDSGEMPEEGTLHPAEIEFIKQWIKACAPKETPDTMPDECENDDDDDDWGNEDSDFDSDEF
tara:strand:- start:5419 stop:5928 length:510 start_codon:yes stop_codon:yes gene_type:complete